MKLTRWIAMLLCTIVVLVSVQVDHAYAQEQLGTDATSDAVYFPETSFWVDPAFAAYWRNNGGLMTFGYPISRVFYQDGIHRQYFERAIFEHHEDQQGPWAVMLVRLGALNTIERRQDPQQVAFTYRPYRGQLDLPGTYFAETGHAIDARFINYWREHGGVQTFGFPLSDVFMEPSVEDGVLRPVQYFERARFEFHDEFVGTPWAVLLGHLGREALSQRQVPTAAVAPQAATIAARDAKVLGPAPIGRPSVVHCGFNYAFAGVENHAEVNGFYMDAAVETGCEWVRIQCTWMGLQPTPTTDIGNTMWPCRMAVHAAKQRGLKVLMNVTHAPDWAKPADKRFIADAGAFGALLREMVRLTEGNVDAWQIWNEPNLVDETNGIVDPQGFLPLLRAGYLAIKEVDRDALVVFPGLAPTSVRVPEWAMPDDWYLEQLLSLNNGEAGNYFDIAAMQAYGAGNDPDTYWPGNPAVNPGWVAGPEFYFRHAERMRSVFVQFGLGDKPVWISEMGWPVGNFNDVWGYGEWITPQLQATYIQRAFEIMRTEWHWVDTAFVWHLNFAEAGGPEHDWTGFSLFSADRQPSPAYSAMSHQARRWMSLED